MSLPRSLLVLAALLGARADHDGCKTIAIGDENRGSDSYALISRGRFIHEQSLPLIYIKDSCNVKQIPQEMLNRQGYEGGLVLVREEVTVCSEGKAPLYVLPVQNFVFSPVVAVCNNSTCGGCGRLWVSTVQYCAYPVSYY